MRGWRCAAIDLTGGVIAWRARTQNLVIPAKRAVPCPCGAKGRALYGRHEGMPKEAALIKYNIDYQFMPKGHSRPRDDGEVVGISATDEKGVVILPNVGDYVHVDNSSDGGERAAFSGKVRSRAFSLYPSVR